MTYINLIVILFLYRVRMESSQKCLKSISRMSQLSGARIAEHISILS